MSKPESIDVHQQVQVHRAGTDDLFNWVRLVKAEYAEMPGMHLSKRQAQRLWNLDPRTCDVIFEALEASHFLRRMPDDSYVRADIHY